MRYVFTTILLFIFYVSQAWGVVLIQRGAATTECSVSTDSIGYDTVATGTAGDLAIDQMYLSKFTPLCASGCSSGTLGDAYLYNYAETDDAKLCLYLDDGDDTPDSGDSLVECVAISSNVATVPDWFSAASAGSSVSCSSTYWVGIVPSVTKWRIYYDSNAGATLYYKSGSAYYDSPPSDLSGTWNTTGGRDYSGYFEIGP